MNIFIAERVIAACKQCLDEPLDKGCGLCTNIDLVVSAYVKSIPGNYVSACECLSLTRQLRWHVFSQWPLYSGEQNYPVPSAHPDGAAYAAYSIAFEEGTLWTGEYGDLRRDLCQFTIDYLTRFYNLK